MQAPPIQCTMAGHSESVRFKRRLLVRFAGVLIGVCLFASGVVFSLEFFGTPQTGTHALSASVAESLAARSSFTTVSLLAQSAIVVNIDSGAVVYQLNADAQLPLASLTKVPLALAASEVLPPRSVVTIGYDTGYNSKASQLLAGERWHAKDLIAYTLVSSSNDGARILSAAAGEALAAKYRLAGRDATLWRMNNLVRTLGLKSMYFLNTTGLDESETQSGAYGSARDVAALFSFANFTAPDLFAETATSSISILSLDGRVARATNTDEALESLTGIIMGKTGFTDLAGGNLAVLFEANGRRYAAVVLGSTAEGRFSDMRQLTAATLLIQNL